MPSFSISLQQRRAWGNCHNKKNAATKWLAFVKISMDAVCELGLKVGQDAYAVIKATSVMVGVPD